MTKSIAKHRCEGIAKDVNRLLQLSTPLTWRNVREYYSPNLFGSVDFLSQYGIHEQRLIIRALNRELRYLHAR